MIEETGGRGTLYKVEDASEHDDVVSTVKSHHVERDDIVDYHNQTRYSDVVGRKIAENESKDVAVVVVVDL